MRVDAEVSEGRGLFWPLLLSGLSAGLLFFLGLHDTVRASTFLAAVALSTGLSFLALSHVVGRSRRTRPRRVGADARGLSVDGKLVLPRQSILRTTVREERGGYGVTIEGRGVTPSRTVHVQSARIAQALADTLEQTPHEVMQFDALPPWAHRMRWLTIVLTTAPWVVFNLVRHMPGWSVFAVLGLYGVIALPVLLPQKISIGEDGLLLRWAGRRRFLPFGRLREARGTPLGVILVLEDGDAIEVRLSHRTDAETARRTTILAMIDGGLRRHRALQPAEDQALLGRGPREIDAWIEEMTRLGAADAQGYRAIALPRERLWSVLENPLAEPSAREGAALALRVRLDDDERLRLRRVAAKTASPRLRVALDAVHAADVEQLRIALREAEDSDQDEPRNDARAAR